MPFCARDIEWLPRTGIFPRAPRLRIGVERIPRFIFSWLLTCGISIGLICCAALISAAQAQNQVMPPAPSPDIFYSSAEPLTTTIARTSKDPRPDPANGGYPMMGWLLFGNVTTGAAYDSNYYSSANSPSSVYGARFQPTLLALRSTGIQRTTVYATGDIRYYPSLGRTSLIDTTLGAVHLWEIQRDLMFRVQGQVAAGEENSGLTSLSSSSASGAGILPVRYTKTFGSSSLEKQFGNFFTAMGGSVTNLAYQNTQDTLGNSINETFRDGNLFTVNTRFGYHVSPIVYVYTEPSANWNRYNQSSLNSDGYQVKVGVGSDRIGLVNGEIYSGYRQQHFADPTVSMLSGSLYGGKLNYYPTELLVLTGTVEQTLGVSDFGATGGSTGTATNMTTSRFSAAWDASRRFGFNGRVEYRDVSFLNANRLDTVLIVGGGGSYMITPRYGVSVDVSHWRQNSNVTGASYSRDIFSMGLITKY